MDNKMKTFKPIYRKQVQDQVAGFFKDDDKPSGTAQAGNMKI
jgi:hypothetical protein